MSSGDLPALSLVFSVSDNLSSTFVCAAVGVIPPSPPSVTEPAEAPPCLVNTPPLVIDIWSLYNFVISSVGPNKLDVLSPANLTVLFESSDTSLIPPGGSLFQVPIPRICEVID